MAVWFRSSLAAAATWLLASCTGVQSSLNAQALQSEEIKRVLLIFIAVAAVVWGGVMLALLLGQFRRRPPGEQPLNLEAAVERCAGRIILPLGLAPTVTVLVLSIVSY